MPLFCEMVKDLERENDYFWETLPMLEIPLMLCKFEEMKR